MRKEAIPFHLDVLNKHNTLLYENLLHSFQTTSTLKEMKFLNQEGDDVFERGFFAKKEIGGIERKYFIKKKDREQMPFKIRGSDECKIKINNGYDIIIIPNNIVPFKIKAEKKMTIKTLIDTLLPFTHTNPDHYLMEKIVAVALYSGKGTICISSPSEFGKTTVFDVLHSLTDKCPVFKPRTVPGLMHNINETGIIVFDEATTKAEVREIQEEISLDIGYGKSVYINGALKAKGLKQKYDISEQSMVYLYNELSYYKNPEKSFFDYCFDNNKAMDSRFLKLKLEGRLTEIFDKDFNIQAVAEENKMLYINIVKTLLWLRDVIKSNAYERRFVSKGVLNLKGRRLQTYSLITLILDMVCECQAEFEGLVGVLDKAVIDYREMLNVDGYVSGSGKL